MVIEAPLRHIPEIDRARAALNDLELVRRSMVAAAAVNMVMHGDPIAWAHRLETLHGQLRLELAELERQYRSLECELERERQIFPSEGVFLVEGSGGRSWMKIAQLGELPDPMPLASIMRRHMEITAAVRQCWERYHAEGKQSPWDVAVAIMDAIAKADAATL